MIWAQSPYGYKATANETNTGWQKRYAEIYAKFRKSVKLLHFLVPVVFFVI